MTEGTGGIARRGFLTGLAAAGGTGVLGAVMTPTAAEAAPTEVVPVSDPRYITRRDQQYRELVSGVNKRYVGNPEAVVLVTDINQIPDIVRHVVRTGKRLSIRSGGHCLENFVDNPQVELVLDVSNLDRMYFDPRRNAFAVETGAKLLDFYDFLYRLWGVTIPAGICYSVGMGGHVSGGGWGLLCRQYGLVIDHLYAVEVVVCDRAGRVRTVVATRERTDPNRELWWAHAGGGGGSFGVVTRYWFRGSSGLRV